MQGDSAGYFREVCIDTLKFNIDGTIQPVVPTIEGIQPVSLSAGGGGTAVPVVKEDQPKGNVISREIYALNGVKVDDKNMSLEKGVYLLKKRYDSGAVTFTKIIISDPKSKMY